MKCFRIDCVFVKNPHFLHWSLIVKSQPKIIELVTSRPGSRSGSPSHPKPCLVRIAPSAGVVMLLLLLILMKVVGVVFHGHPFQFIPLFSLNSTSSTLCTQVKFSLSLDRTASNCREIKSIAAKTLSRHNFGPICSVLDKSYQVPITIFELAPDSESLWKALSYEPIRFGLEPS